MDEHMRDFESPSSWHISGMKRLVRQPSLHHDALLQQEKAGNFSHPYCKPRMTHVVILSKTASYGHYLGSLIEHLDLSYKLVLDNKKQIDDALSPQPCATVLENDPPGEAWRKLTTRHSKIPFIIIDGSKQGVEPNPQNCTVLSKPLDVSSFWMALDKAVNGKQKSRALLQKDSDSFPLIIGASRAAKNIRKDIARVAPTEFPVLLLGDTGTGKGLAALAIHKASQRGSSQFMEINCATLPVNLMESELFGYKQGAFTGAWRDKPGKFQLAEEGTILLDEISEMSLYMQAKLLQVLQEGEFSAVGGMENVKVNVRIIAASNSNLKKLIGDGTFRSDLYYRLAVITMRLPSLKERKEDILPLANYFMDKYSNVYHKHGLRITDQLLSLLEAYDWPGNVRELENVIKSFVALENEAMVCEQLQKRIESREPETIQEISLPQRFDLESDFSLRKFSGKAAEKAERKLIQRAVQETNGNKKRAARLLGVSYKCMLNKIKEYGM